MRSTAAKVAKASKAPAAPDRRVYLIIAALVMMVLAVYHGAGSHPFSSYDDTVYVTRNPHVLAGLTLDSVRWAFTSPHGSNWHPLTGVSLMTDVQLTKWLGLGDSAAVFHWTSIILHAANSVLLFMVLATATGFTWRSAFVAALFALHPQHVESVAWIAERKDVLSTFFWLLATLSYVTMHRKAVRTDARLLYAATLLCLALGLMTKPMVVTLPLTLLLLDYWPLGRVGWSASRRVDESRTSGRADPQTRGLVIEKLPLFAVAAGSALMTVAANRAAGRWRA